MLMSLGRAAVLAGLLALLPGAVFAAGHPTAPVQSADCTTVTGLHPGNLVVTGCTVISDAHVTGKVIVQPGAVADILNSTVDGAVTSNQASALVVCSSTLGSLAASPASLAGIVVGDPGDKCPGNTIAGAVRFDGLNQGGLEFVDNRVGGSVTIVNFPNPAFGSFEEGANVIAGSLHCTAGPAGNYADNGDGGPDQVTGAIVGNCETTRIAP